jgi:hypothetical protein
MSVSGVPYGYSTWSSAATCNFSAGSPSIPSNAVNISYQFTSSPPTGNGAFSTDSVYVLCGNYYVQGIPLSIANLYITAFAGLPANVTCYLQFHGKCNGTGLGGTPCSLAFTNIVGCIDYQY